MFAYLRQSACIFNPAVLGKIYKVKLEFKLKDECLSGRQEGRGEHSRQSTGLSIARWTC